MPRSRGGWLEWMVVLRLAAGGRLKAPIWKSDVSWFYCRSKAVGALGRRRRLLWWTNKTPVFPEFEKDNLQRSATRTWGCSDVVGGGFSGTELSQFPCFIYSFVFEAGRDLRWVNARVRWKTKAFNVNMGYYYYYYFTKTNCRWSNNNVYEINRRENSSTNIGPAWQVYKATNPYFRHHLHSMLNRN